MVKIILTLTSADLGREGGGEHEPAPLDGLERLDLGREGARRDGGPVFGEDGLSRLVGRLDLVPSAASARMPPSSAGRMPSSHLRKPYVQYFRGLPAGVVPP